MSDVAHGPLVSVCNSGCDRYRDDKSEINEKQLIWIVEKSDMYKIYLLVFSGVDGTNNQEQTTSSSESDSSSSEFENPAER